MTIGTNDLEFRSFFIDTDINYKDYKYSVYLEIYGNIYAGAYTKTIHKAEAIGNYWINGESFKDCVELSKKFGY